MQKVSSSLIQSISASQLLRSNAVNGQVLSYNDAISAWVPVDYVGGATGITSLTAVERLSISVDVSGAAVFSASNMLLGNSNEGPFFGNTTLTESQLQIDESSIGKQWTFVTGTEVKTITSEVSPELTASVQAIRFATSSSTKYQTIVYYGGVADVLDRYTLLSKDYGTTWTPVLSNTGGSRHTPLAMSIDGRYQTQASTQFIYVSDDYGATWTNATLAIGSTSWQYVVMSADGKYQLAVAASTTTRGFVYISRDFGKTWAPTSLASLGNKLWYAATMSSDGKYQTAVISGSTGFNLGHIYRSIDFGVTWTAVKNDVSRAWRSLASSADGKYQTAGSVNGVSEGAKLFVSSNYGLNWSLVTDLTATSSWGSITMSQDGRLQFALKDSVIVGSYNWGKNWSVVTPVSSFSSSNNTGRLLLANNGQLFHLNPLEGLYKSVPTTVLDANLKVTTSVTTSAVYAQVYYGDGSKLTGLSGLNVGTAIGTTTTMLTGDGETLSFVLSSYNGFDKGRYIVSVGGLDQPPPFWTVDFSAGNGRITFIEAPKDGELISIRTITGVTIGMGGTGLSGGDSNAITIQSRPVASVAPTEGQALVWSDANQQWEPQTILETVNTTITQLTGNGTTSVFAFSGFNTSNKGKYLVSVGGLDQPPDFWSVSFVDGSGRITFVDAPKSGEIISVRALSGNGLVGAGSFGSGNAILLQSRMVADIQPLSGQVLAWNHIASEWQPLTKNDGNAIQLHSRTIADVEPTDGQFLVWNQSLNQWEPQSAARTLNTITTELTGTGSTASFFFSGYNGLDKGKYLVSVGGLDQPPSFWTVDFFSNKGRITFVDAPKTGEVISVKSLSGTTLTERFQPGNALQLQSKGIASTAPFDGEALIWNTANNQWEPRSITGGVLLLSGGSLVGTLSGGVAATIWSAKDSARNWKSVAMSSDGSKRTAVVDGGFIYTSNDSGNTWVAKTTTPRAWKSVAMSSDGTIQTAVVDGGQIYVSSDSGNTWPARDSSRGWISVAMSSDGTKQTAVEVNGFIYVSTNSGSSWVARDTVRIWTSVAMSSDGTRQTAVVQSGQIYVSTNSGNNWVAKDSSRDWSDVAMSSDGSIQTAVIQAGQIYVSTDSGNNWVAKDAVRSWTSVAMSSDGTKQTAVASSGQIYVSVDSGNTWDPKESNRIWSAVAMSSDGTRRTAVVYGGNIYTYNENFVATLTINSTIGDIQANSATLYTSVSAPALSGAFFGDGSRITGIIAIDAARVPLSGGTMFGPLSAPALSGVFFGDGSRLVGVTSSGRLALSGGTMFGDLTGTRSAFTVSISAPALSGAHFGDGSRLTGIIAVDAARVALSGGTMFGPLSAPALSGIFFGDGSRLFGVSSSDKLPLSGGTLVGNLTGTRATFTISVSAFSLSSTNASFESDIKVSNITIGRGGGEAFNVNSVALGRQALSANSSGMENTAVGAFSLANNSIASGNTGIGTHANASNSTGVYNVAVGHEALKLNNGGGFNTVVGSNAGKNTSGSYNTLLGHQAGVSLTNTDSNNTLIGTHPGAPGLSGTIIIAAGSVERIRVNSNGLMTVQGSVSAATLSGIHFGDGSRLTSVLGTDTTKLHLSGGTLTGTLSGTVATFTRATFTTSVSAPALSGTFYGDGSKLTGIIGGLITVTTNTPTGGANGDIWFQY